MAAVLYMFSDRYYYYYYYYNYSYDYFLYSAISSCCLQNGQLSLDYTDTEEKLIT